ncbi:NACHT domain-containing protein [Coprococcus comes]|uniref:NACHT domain-containing protein n=1 Tax=Coprococcus comes TaxID=410072 RepID=UPI001C02CA2F|nr:hypothetical protein [Coprococcus comes]MBT9781791.1 hypothetical protein [Coprococcus comes]
MDNIDNKEVLTNAVAKVVEDAALGMWNKVKDYFSEVSAHEQIELGYAYEEYLKNTKSKNSKIKTLIYRHVPKDLYSFYECVGVQYDGDTIDTKTINNIISEGNKIIISGTGGIGKTTMLKHFYLNTIEDTSYIPVLVELRMVNSMEVDNISMYAIVFDNLVNNGFRMEDKYYRYSLEEGGYVILLDGFDEINREKIPKLTEEIISFSGKYPQNKYIITSRPTDSFMGWNDYIEMSAMELTKEQALSLISKIDFDEKVKKTFYRELNEKLYDKYKSFASNPLLLTIMLLTFDNRASIPDKLNDFYEQAFATLFNMHDATKEAYVRDIRTGLGCEDFKLIFAYFCFKSYFAGDTEFTEVKLRQYIEICKAKFPNISFKTDDFLTDLTQSVCMLVKEGINYRFTHRSFQEYFAAWYTCKLVDKDQVDLLTNWIKETDRIQMDSYFAMLYNLQSEKVNKIILYPGLKQIRKKYMDTGYSIKFLKYMFSGVCIERQIEDGGERKYSFSYRIKNRYLCNILRATCQLNGYTYPELNKDFENEMAGKFEDKWNGSVIYFGTVLKKISEQDLLMATEWLKQQVEFSINLARSFENDGEKSGKKVSDILARL